MSSEKTAGTGPPVTSGRRDCWEGLQRPRQPRLRGCSSYCRPPSKAATGDPWSEGCSDKTSVDKNPNPLDFPTSQKGILLLICFSMIFKCKNYSSLVGYKRMASCSLPTLAFRTVPGTQQVDPQPVTTSKATGLQNPSCTPGQLLLEPAADPPLCHQLSPPAPNSAPKHLVLQWLLWA